MLKDNTFHSVQCPSPFTTLGREVALEANGEGQAIALLEMQKPLLGHTLVVTPHPSVSLSSVNMLIQILLLQRICF